MPLNSHLLSPVRSLVNVAAVALIPLLNVIGYHPPDLTFSLSFVHFSSFVFPLSGFTLMVLLSC
jgi:hypothetical protein